MNLKDSVILIPEEAHSTTELVAAGLLCDEVERRTGMRLRTSARWPDKQATIAIAARASETLAGREIPAREGKGLPELKPEGYRLWLDREKGRQPIVWIVGADGRGVLFGVGRLIRLLDWGSDKAILQEPLDIATSPAYPIRGHQLGYRARANSYDAWDAETYEQYIRELLLFGTNCIENIPFEDEQPSPVMPVPRDEMNVILSGICARYDLGYWVWTASQDYCGYDYGGVLVWTDSSTYYVVDVFNLCEAENTGQWVKREVDLSFFASQVVDLQVRAECDGSLNSNLFVDDVRLGLPEIGDHRVFLPIVQRLAGGGPEPFAPACSASNSYCEPYNTWSTAYGRLQPNVEYRAYPNDSNDYYYFTIDHTTSLTVRVTSYNATGQVLVRRQDLSEVAKDYNVPPSADGTMQIPLPNLPAGRYYIQVFTSEGQQSSSRYNLKIQ